jgi:putative ABC transport system permease protein
VQFTVSFALLIGMSFMYLQNFYMQHSPLGYDRDELITVANLTDPVNKSLDAFTDQLKEYSGIEAVTYAQDLLAVRDYYGLWGDR